MFALRQQIKSLHAQKDKALKDFNDNLKYGRQPCLYMSKKFIMFNYYKTINV